MSNPPPESGVRLEYIDESSNRMRQLVSLLREGVRSVHFVRFLSVYWLYVNELDSVSVILVGLRAISVVTVRC